VAQQLPAPEEPPPLSIASDVDAVAHRSLRARLVGAELARFKKVVAQIDHLRAGQ